MSFGLLLSLKEKKKNNKQIQTLSDFNNIGKPAVMELVFPTQSPVVVAKKCSQHVITFSIIYTGSSFSSTTCQG